MKKRLGHDMGEGVCTWGGPTGPALFIIITTVEVRGFRVLPLLSALN